MPKPKPPERALPWLATLLLAFSCVALAAPQAKLLPFWKQSDEFNKTRIDHSAWGEFLRKYASEHESGINRVDYASVASHDRAALDAYIDGLEAIAIRSYNRNEQFAYWVNLYNAATVRLVLEQYPIRSITKISFSLFGFGPWDEPLLKVEKQLLSLNDIEHGILRPIWRDKRIHYVVNCASLGCPNLMLKPFNSRDIEAQLSHAEHEFVHHPRGFALEGGSLRLSKIYEWYASDFGANELAVAKSLIAIKTSEIPEDDEEALAVYQDWLESPKQKRRISYNYDWSLNRP